MNPNITNRLLLILFGLGFIAIYVGGYFNMPWIVLIGMGISGLAIVTYGQINPEKFTWELPLGITKEQAISIIYLLSFASVIFGIIGAFWSNALDWFYWIWTVVYGAVYIWIIIIWLYVLVWAIYVLFIKNASSEEKKEAHSVLEGWIIIMALFIIVMAINIKWKGWDIIFESLPIDLRNFTKIVTHPGQHPFS